MKPGPKAQPAYRLRVAAIEFAAALEWSRGIPKREWDRLVKAALHYRKNPRTIGRPRSA